MDETANLALPYLMPSQAQKHITHNEALARLDAIVHLAVLDRDLAAPPDSPADGDRYLVADTATGAWAGWDGAIAARIEGSWVRLEPRDGWLCWIADESVLLAWNGTAWTGTGTSSELQNLTRLGLGATADASHPFSARLNAAQWAATPLADSGTGDLRLSLSKESGSGVVSLLFADNFSARGEIGLVGNDDLALRVSPDGTAWADALIADKTDGTVRFPAGIVDPVTASPMRSLVFTPGGDGTVSIWRSDLNRTDNPRTATISAVSGDTITLSGSEAQKFGRFTDFMSNCAYVRIWNASKTPEEPAWVKDSSSSSALTVLDAAAITGWNNGDTIRLGDPTGMAPVASFALDISPLLQNVLGAVFRQSGILAKLLVTGNAASAILSVSEAALSGSLMQVRSFADGTTQSSQIVIPCSVLSPISNSNLVFVREQGSLAVAAINLVGIYT